METSHLDHAIKGDATVLSDCTLAMTTMTTTNLIKVNSLRYEKFSALKNLHADLSLTYRQVQKYSTDDLEKVAMCSSYEHVGIIPISGIITIVIFIFSFRVTLQNAIMTTLCQSAICTHGR